MIGKQFSKSRPIPVATPVTCRICTGRYTDWILGSFIMLEKLSNFPLEHFMSWLVFSFSDVHPKEWPKSNIKRFVSKFMKTFRTILQCYLIQINIFGQFIAIIGVRKKWLLFLFFPANLLVIAVPSIVSYLLINFYQNFTSLLLCCGQLYVFCWQLSEYNSP